MKYQDIFKRYELKYLLTKEQEAAVLDTLKDKMELDEYGLTSIRNIYYDTPNYRLIRTSLEKPVYKEKLRIRSYGKTDDDSTVFVEIKKKYGDVVYKRRLALPEKTASDWLNSNGEQPVHTQIADEIDYFKNYYRDLKPACCLSYDRRAYKDLTEHDLRLTLDTNILARTSDIDFAYGTYGAEIIPENQTLMEFKTPGSIPLWLINCLEENEIKQIPFSKYGKAYKDLIHENINYGEYLYV